MQLADTHCHLDFPQYDGDRQEVLLRAKEAGVKLIVNAGSTLESSQAALLLAREFSEVLPAVGIHPHDASGATEEVCLKLERLSGKKEVCAIGEIGLDYFKNFSPADLQRKLFIRLLALAKKRELPVIIHSRKAEADTLSIIRDFMPLKAVVHCFSGDEDFLNACLNLGFFVSFTCNITYKKSEALREIVKLAPLERIFLETDAPYLSPEGKRGERNEPAWVRQVAEEIARLKLLSVEEVAGITTENALSFFKRSS